MKKTSRHRHPKTFSLSCVILSSLILALSVVLHRIEQRITAEVTQPSSLSLPGAS